MNKKRCRKNVFQRYKNMTNPFMRYSNSYVIRDQGLPPQIKNVFLYFKQLNNYFKRIF